MGLEALAGMNTVNQIAQEYGVDPMQVGNGSGISKLKPRVCLKASEAHNRFQPRVRPIGFTVRSDV